MQVVKLFQATGMFLGLFEAETYGCRTSVRYKNDEYALRMGSRDCYDQMIGPEVKPCEVQAGCDTGPKDPPAPKVALSGVDFRAALNWLKDGKRAYRKGWTENGFWLAHWRPVDADAVIMIYGGNKAGVPWIPQQADLLAHDWVLLA